MADARCPMCGKPNPEELDACQFCEARLKPLLGFTPDDSQPIHAGDKPIKRQTSELEKVKPGDDSSIHAGEEPTRKDTGELEHSLPSWLKSLREGGKQPPAESSLDASPDLNLPEESQVSPSTESSIESLDWLTGLGTAAVEDEQEVPDWMAGLRTPSDVAPAPEASSLSGPEQAQPEEDWMARLSGESGQPSPAPLEQASESTPDWLSRLGEGRETPRPPEKISFEIPAGAPVEEPVVEQVFPAENLPDWLEALKSKATAPEESPLSAADDLPDWLSGLPAVSAGIPSAAPDIDPDWLSKLKEKTAEPETQEFPAQSISGTQVPGLLSSLDEEAIAGVPSVFNSEPSPVGDSSAEVSDWLSQLKSDVKVASEAEKSTEEFERVIEPFPADNVGESIPDWLSGVDQTAAPAASTPALVMADEGKSSGEPSPAAFSLETPDWLSKLRPERGAEIPASVPEDTKSDTLETAELPSWVQAMRPVESVISGDRPFAPDETGAAEASGPLAGLRGVLPSNPGLGAIRKPPAYAIKLQVSNNQQRYAAQLEKMVMDEGLAGGPKSAPLISNQVWRLVISIVLIMAVLLPLVAGRQFTPDMNLYPSEWEKTSRLLDGFPVDTPMLLVFDYDPAFSGELEASAAPVIDHVLFLGSRLALVSTVPTGPALAEQFLRSTQSYHLGTGLQYTNLGYLAGGPAGVLSFATDPVAAARLTVNGEPAWETPALQGVGRLSDFAAIIILTDNADTGRVWIEQMRPAIDNGTPGDYSDDTPILMIISAQAEPMIRPYFASGQIKGLVTGLAGGKAYEQSYATPGLGRRYWDSFGLGTLAAEIMIVAGGAWGAIIAWRNRKKTGEEA